MIERITMETPLHFRDVTGSEWIPNASIGSLIPEAGSYFISGDRVDSDPQLFFYGDFATFLVEGKRVAFWSVFGATGFFAGLIVYFFWRNHLSRSSSRTGARAPLISSHMIGSSREMPLVFVGFSALVLALSVAMMFAGALQTGATTDEPAHVRHLTTFLIHIHFTLCNANLFHIFCSTKCIQPSKRVHTMCEGDIKSNFLRRSQLFHLVLLLSY